MLDLKRVIVYPLDGEHLHHPLSIDHQGTEAPTLTEDGGFQVFVTDTPVVTCLLCNVRLMPGEDLLLREPEPWEA